MKPLAFINFKTYPQGSGNKSVAFAKKLKKIKSPYKIIAVPQLVNLSEVSKHLPVYAQHADCVQLGRNTGYVAPKSLKLAGCQGVFLNHSEHKIPFRKLSATIKECRKVNLKVLVFAGSLSAINKMLKLNPDYIAYEPAKLVGGKISVTSANPKVISKAAALVKKKKKVKLIVGAGVHSKSDVETALLLGASGIAVASAIMKGTDKQIKDILTARQ